MAYETTIVRDKPKRPAKRSHTSVPIVPQEITIHELQPFHCKAVIGRSKSRDLPTYCGKERMVDKSYCAEHQKQYKGTRT